MIKDLCFNDDLSDCKIICEEQSFPCHKFILSLRSDVFKTMFQNMDLNEGNVFKDPLGIGHRYIRITYLLG